eukprot:362107-Chlamydomonas_euryale.AAC.10
MLSRRVGVTGTCKRSRFHCLRSRAGSIGQGRPQGAQRQVLTPSAHHFINPSIQTSKNLRRSRLPPDYPINPITFLISPLCPSRRHTLNPYPKP